MNSFWIFLEFLHRHFSDDLFGIIGGDPREDKASIIVELDIIYLMRGDDIESKGDIHVIVPQ